MAATDITTLTAVKSVLSDGTNQLGNTSDTVLNRLITAASGLVARYCGYPNGMQIQNYTDTFVGSGETQRSLRYYPVQSVSTVTDGLLVIPQSPDGNQSGWFLADDQVWLIGYSFDLTTICTVVYSAGLFAAAPGPAELEQVVIELIMMKFKRNKNRNMISEALAAGAGTATFVQEELTKDMKLQLAPFMRVTLS